MGWRRRRRSAVPVLARGGELPLSLLRLLPFPLQAVKTLPLEPLALPRRQHLRKKGRRAGCPYAGSGTGGVLGGCAWDK